MIAFFVASTIVTLLEFLRVREPRLLPLLALFAFLALAHARGEWDPWGRLFHFGAGIMGLALLVALGPRGPRAGRRP